MVRWTGFVVVPRHGLLDDVVGLTGDVSQHLFAITQTLLHHAHVATCKRAPPVPHLKSASGLCELCCADALDYTAPIGVCVPRRGREPHAQPAAV